MPKPFPTNIKSGPGQGASGKPGPQGPEGPGFAPSIDLTGNRAQQAVIGLRERPISADPPDIGNVYAWDGVQWSPVAQSGGGGNVPDPDTGNVFDVLTVYGNYSPAATILDSLGNLWAVNCGGSTGHGKPSLIRTNLSTNRPDLVILGPSNEEWYDVIEIPGSVLVIIGDDAVNGMRFMRAVDLSVSPPLLGASLYIGDRPITTDYGNVRSPGSLAFDGTYIWTVTYNRAAYVQYTGAVTLVNVGTIILSDGDIEFPTLPTWVTYDPNGSNYSDGFPRLWFLSCAINADTPYYSIIDRVVVDGTFTYPIDLSVQIPNLIYRPYQLLIGGNRLFYLQLGDDGNVARINPDTGVIEEWAILDETPASFTYDPETSTLLISVVYVGYGILGHLVFLAADFSTRAIIDLPQCALPGAIGAVFNPAYPPISHLSMWNTPGGHGWIPSGGYDSIFPAPVPNTGSLIQVDMFTHVLSYLNHHLLMYAQPSGGDATDLTNTFFVDWNTTGSQDGSSENPFSTIAQAVTALAGGGTILIVPGNYSSESTITCGVNIGFINLSGLVIAAGSSRSFSYPQQVYLPPLTGNGAKTIQGCNVSQPIDTTDGDITLINCDISAAVNSYAALSVAGSMIRADLTSDNVTVFSNCVFFNSVTINLSPSYSVSFYDCDSDYYTIRPSINFNSPGGVMYVDAATWYNFKLKTPSYGPTLTYTTVKIMGGIGSEGADVSPSNTNLSTNSSTAVFAVNNFGMWFAPSSDYTIVLGARVLFWQPLTKTNTGCLDMTVCLHVTTNISGVATVELKSSVISNSSYLPAILSTAVGTITATAGGFTIYATRPTGVAFTARARWWFASAELLA